MRRNYRRFCCMNNNYSNINDDCSKKNLLENSCNNVCDNQNYNENCSCGFDEYEGVFPENPMLAQSYVPTQFLDETFKPCVGLKNGTIFPELVSPYEPGDSMKQIMYLQRTNTIGKGCNQ